MEKEGDDDRIAAATIVLFAGVNELTVGRLVGVAIDLALVDVLARLHLQALRVGCTIRVRAPAQALEDLLDLVGLSALVE